MDTLNIERLCELSDKYKHVGVILHPLGCPKEEASYAQITADGNTIAEINSGGKRYDKLTDKTLSSVKFKEVSQHPKYFMIDEDINHCFFDSNELFPLGPKLQKYFSGLEIKLKEIKPIGIKRGINNSMNSFLVVNGAEYLDQKYFVIQSNGRKIGKVSIFTDYKPEDGVITAVSRTETYTGRKVEDGKITGKKERLEFKKEFLQS